MPKRTYVYEQSSVTPLCATVRRSSRWMVGHTVCLIFTLKTSVHIQSPNSYCVQTDNKANLQFGFTA